MDFQLVTLLGTAVDKPVYEVIIPTMHGEISVFPSHEPLVTLSKSGIVYVREKKDDADEDMELFAISGGVVEISQTHVRILVDEADHGADIIEAETQAALDRALKARDEATDQVELEKASQLVDRHMTRLKVADLQRHRRRRN